MKFTILELNQELFKPFGKILEPIKNQIPEVSEKGIFDFFVVFKEFCEGWQVGFLKYKGKILKYLECHPTTPEVFINLKGKTILLLAINPIDDIVAFNLNKPIVINPGVWHGLISLSKESEIFIVENENVTDEFYTFKENYIEVKGQLLKMKSTV